VRTLSEALERASWRGTTALKQVLPAGAAARLLEALTVLLKSEPTLVDVRPAPRDWLCGLPRVP
jgi:hypothetical protein